MNDLDTAINLVTTKQTPVNSDGEKGERKLKKTIGLSVIGFSCLLAWLIWGPILKWLFTFVPAGEWEKLIKLVIIIIVGWGGGIALPIGIFLIGVLIFFKRLW